MKTSIDGVATLRILRKWQLNENQLVVFQSPPRGRIFQTELIVNAPNKRLQRTRHELASFES
jgi:hypothetical protein